MNKVIKTALATIGLNIVSLIVVFMPAMGFMLIPLSIVAQLVIGIIYCTKPDKKQLGQGMLLGLGVFLVVGFSVCTVMLMNTNFH